MNDKKSLPTKNIPLILDSATDYKYFGDHLPISK